MREEPRVVSIKIAGTVIDHGKEFARSMPSHARFRYSQTIAYALADGREFRANLRAETKPKLTAKFTSAEESIERGSLFLTVEDGCFVGTILRMSLTMR